MLLGSIKVEIIYVNNANEDRSEKDEQLILP